MTEKRYKLNEYVDCYCDKHANILVGFTYFKYLNILSVVIFAVLTIWGLLVGINMWYELLSFLFFVMAILFIPIDYRTTKAKMLKAGHSEECSRKIARMYTLRASLWSDFKIMEDKDDGKRVWH
jgi:hypothetical protein